MLGLWLRLHSTYRIDGRVRHFYYRWFSLLLSGCYTQCLYHIKHTDTDKSNALLFSIQFFHLFNLLCVFRAVNSNT